MKIYKITNIKNNKFYIGKTKNMKKRWNSHKRNSKDVNNKTHLYNAMREDGVENFIIEELFHVFNESDLDDIETYFIKKYDAIKQGYNILPGGEGGHFSEKNREISSKLRKGKTFEEQFGEERAKDIKERKNKASSESLKGRNITWGEKVSVTLLEKHKSNTQFHQSVIETNRKIGEKRRGIPREKHTQEIKDLIKYKLGLVDLSWSEERKLEMSKRVSGENNPSYKEIDLILVYKTIIKNNNISLDELSQLYNISRGILSARIVEDLKIESLRKFRSKNNRKKLVNIIEERLKNVLCDE